MISFYVHFTEAKILDEFFQVETDIKLNAE